MSIGPPAAAATTMVTGRAGQSCACAGGQSAASTAIVTQRHPIARFSFASPSLSPAILTFALRFVTRCFASVPPCDFRAYTPIVPMIAPISTSATSQ